MITWSPKRSRLEPDSAADAIVSRDDRRRDGALGILAALNETATDTDIAAVVEFALPLPQSHVDAVRKQSLRLAAEEDPSELA